MFIGKRLTQLVKRLALELLHPAVARILVVAPAAHLRAVPDAVVGDVVERHLDHELGAELDPLELALVVPAAGLARSPLAGLVRREASGQLALLRSLEAG